MGVVLADSNLRTELELAADEALLDAGRDTWQLRFWEASDMAVVLGRGNTSSTEVNEAACKADAIPILRRASGGGTVLQGPGVYNYALVLPMTLDPALTTISSTNDWVMNNIAKALQPDCPEIQVSGYTDLSIHGKKCSGNAQRRSRSHVLFHGCFLCELDVALISKYLSMPSRMPEYRQTRSHDDFLAPVPLSRAQIKAGIRHLFENMLY